jgi:hypothetical protein
MAAKLLPRGALVERDYGTSVRGAASADSWPALCRKALVQGCCAKRSSCLIDYLVLDPMMVCA